MPCLPGGVLENVKINLGCEVGVYIVVARSGDLKRGESSPGGWSQRV